MLVSSHCDSSIYLSSHAVILHDVCSCDMILMWGACM